MFHDELADNTFLRCDIFHYPMASHVIFIYYQYNIMSATFCAAVCMSFIDHMNDIEKSFKMVPVACLYLI